MAKTTTSKLKAKLDKLFSEYEIVTTEGCASALVVAKKLQPLADQHTLAIYSVDDT